MKHQNDKQFESYLRRFQPVPPAAFRIVKSRSRLRLSQIAWLALAATLLLLATITSRVPLHRSVIRERVLTEPLTIRSANAWLADSPSLDTALNVLEFPLKRPPGKRPDEQSVIAVLSEERIKP